MTLTEQYRFNNCSGPCIYGIPRKTIGIFLAFLFATASSLNTSPPEDKHLIRQAQLPVHIDTRSPFQKISSMGENLKTQVGLIPLNSGMQVLHTLNKASSNNHFDQSIRELKKFNRPSMGVVGGKEDPLSYSEYQKYFLGTAY